jgi:hypothetical protein
MGLEIDITKEVAINEMQLIFAQNDNFLFGPQRRSSVPSRPLEKQKSKQFYL